MTAPKTIARIAGSLYLIVATGGTFAVFYVGSRLVDPDDAAATADNIRASADLYRAGIASNFLATVCFLLTAMALYLLLRQVNKPVAAAMVTFVAVGAAIGCINLVSQYTALTVATSEEYTSAFGEAGADALTLLFANPRGGPFSEVFFGVWLLPLGYLVIRSGFLPRALGILLIVGGFAYVADVFLQFLAPDLSGSIGPFLFGPAALTELVFVGWLLVKAVQPVAPDGQADVQASAIRSRA